MFQETIFPFLTLDDTRSPLMEIVPQPAVDYDEDFLDIPRENSPVDLVERRSTSMTINEKEPVIVNS